MIIIHNWNVAISPTIAREKSDGIYLGLEPLDAFAGARHRGKPT